MLKTEIYRTGIPVGATRRRRGMAGYRPPAVTTGRATTSPSSRLLSSVSSTEHYIWGLDLSGTPQGAGGVGGLLTVIQNNIPFYPLCDANGHQKSAKPKPVAQGGRDFKAVRMHGARSGIPRHSGNCHVTEYLTFVGFTVAHYEYDAFGNTIAKSGSKADEFKFRFSTKYLDKETGLVQHNHRYYAPKFHSFISTDPIEERGGLNLYGFCGNDPINRWDYLGLAPAQENGATDLETAVDKMRKSGAAELRGAADMMKALCDKYFPRPFWPWKKDVNKEHRCECRRDAEIIGNNLGIIWEKEYGKGPDKKNSHSVGGYMCWNWAGFFTRSIYIPEQQGPSRIWKAELRKFENPNYEWVENGVRLRLTHFATKISIKGKGKGAAINVDDGFFPGGGLVHDHKWPPLKDGWREVEVRYYEGGYFN